MRIWFISDTHGFHNELILPDVDTVIHCGDISNSFNPAINSIEVLKFLNWFEILPIKHKVLICGNHDTSVEKGLIKPQNYPWVNWLFHQQVSIEGIKIFGSPYTPQYGDWAYMKKRNRMDLVWATIPTDTDILITHGPPKGIMDLTTCIESGKPIQVGCKSLYNKVKEISPRIHCFGHIHREKEYHNYGIFDNEETKFINCAVFSHRVEGIKSGFILEI